MPIKLVVILLLAGMATLFIIQNVAAVEIQFLFWSIQISRAVLMCLVLFTGFSIGWFAHGYWKLRRTRKGS